MGGKRLNYKELRIIEELLRTRLTIVGEGLCKYTDGKSDDHVVAEARMRGVGDCTKFHVRHIRREVFGDLKVIGAAKTEYAVPGVVLDHLRASEQAIAGLSERYVRLREDINLIMDYLTRTEGVDWSREQSRFGLKQKVSA